MQEKKRQGFVSQTTGELGVERTRRLFLQWAWLPRVYGMDQGIDLMVEVADAGQGIGHVFAVQCKASGNSSQVKRDGVSVRLEGRVISYLLSQRFPTFLFFSPLDTNFVYWADVRRAVNGVSKKKDGSALVKIPLQNRFDVSASSGQKDMRDKFLSALAKSDREFSAISMRLVATAIREKEKRLESLDPRCGVKITASGSGQEIAIVAKEEFSIGASLRPASAADALRMKDAMDFGIDATVAMHEIRFSGSPLFDELANKNSAGKLTVRTGNKVHYVVKLSGSSRALANPRQLRFGGLMSKGMRGASVRASAEDHPVTIDLRIVVEEGAIQLTVHTGFESMVGLRVITQSRLAIAASVLDQISTAGTMCVELVSSELDTQLSAAVTPEMAQVLRFGAMRLSSLEDLKYLCERYRPEFLISRPGATNDKEAEWWKIARRICEGELVEIFANVLTLSGEFSRDLSELCSPDGRVQDLAVCNYQLNIVAFGAPLCTLPIDISFRRFLGRAEGVGDSQNLVLTAGEESKISLRLAGAEPFSDSVILRPAEVAEWNGTYFTRDGWPCTCTASRAAARGCIRSG